MEHARPGETPRHAVVDGAVLGNAEKAKALVACVNVAALATLHGGAPFVSHVVPVLEPDGSVLFLFSGLAEHTRALAVDSRASLLCTESLLGPGDPSALARVTLVGRCDPVPDNDRVSCTERHVARRPHAAHVASFADFRPYRFSVQEEAGVRWIGGFGRAAWIDTAAYGAAKVDPIAAAREAAVGHAEAAREVIVGALAAKLHALDGALADPDRVRAAQILAVDGKGIDLLVRLPEPRAIRLVFVASVSALGDLPAALASLGGSAYG